MEEIEINPDIVKFEEFPADLLTFCAANEIALPSIDSLKGQAIALLAQEANRGTKCVTRLSAKAFFETIGFKTDDAIQPFNKAMGLKKVKARGKYCLVYPFEADKVDIIKRKGCAISGDRDALINAIKEHHRRRLVEVPNDQWQMGHLDPTVADGSEGNLAWQPPVQGKYRDRFKWDAKFEKMWPTAKELSRGKTIDEYYTEEEQRTLLALLKLKFE